MFEWLTGKRAKPTTKPPSGWLKREFNTLIAGVEYVPDGVALLRQLCVGDRVKLLREPDNQHDKNAVAVLNEAGQKLGYIPAKIAAELARSLEHDDGRVSNVLVVEKVAPGREEKRFNAVLRFELIRRRRR